MHMAFSMKVTPEIEELTNICLDNSKMDVCGTDTDFKRCVFGYH